MAVPNNTSALIDPAANFASSSTSRRTGDSR